MAARRKPTRAPKINEAIAASNRATFAARAQFSGRSRGGSSQSKASRSARAKGQRRDSRGRFA